MSSSSKKQKSLESQLKRINKRTAIELFCVVIVLSKGYNIDFRKPRFSTKSKPFLLIDRIFNDKEKIFDLNDHNIDELIEQSYQRQKERTTIEEDKKKETKENYQNKDNNKGRLEIKEIRTSIVMNKLIEIIKEKTIKIFIKRKFSEQVIPQFQWISSIQIDDKKYNQKEIVKIGETMLNFVDKTMEMDKYDLVFDYNRFVEIVNPSKDQKLIDFFNLMEQRRKYVYQFVEEENEFEMKDCKMKEMKKEEKVEEIEIVLNELNDDKFY